jgi:lysophospholipase L1-like esterase
MRNHTLSWAAVALTAALLPCAGLPQVARAEGQWVGAWSSSMQAPIQFPGVPPPPVFKDQTIRMVIRPEIGGERLRLRLSNAFGNAPLRIESVHVAPSLQDARIAPVSDHVVTFSHSTAVEIPVGSPILSDPVEMRVQPFEEIAVSLYIATPTAANTIHFCGQHDTYIAGPGDLTARADLPSPTTTTSTSWNWLAGLEVWNTQRARATVTLGDSITDGAAVKQSGYLDWPDQLAARLRDAHGSMPMAVLNEGIGGNRILYDGAGVSALARLDRDVLANPGVATLIVLEGINDIGWPDMKPPASMKVEHPGISPFAAQKVTAAELIMGLEQIIERAHEHGIRVLGATLTPYEGADYYTTQGEATREEVNRWIRSSGAFDGVIDFDAAVKDPQNPLRFREGYQSGDHLHPSAAGYKAMADAIAIRLVNQETPR